MELNERWDVEAIKQGASVAVTFAVPLTLIARFAVDGDEGSEWAGLLAFGAFVGFVLGAGVAAWRQQRGTPLSHGIVTALGVFIAVQIVFVMIRLLQGEVIRWGRISVSSALTALAGVIGGFLGSFLQRRGPTPYR